MNARERRQLNRIFRFCVWACLLISFQWLAGCSWREPDLPASLPADSFTALKQRVAAIHDLPFKRNVSQGAGISSVASNSFEANFAGEPDAELIPRLAQVYKRIGLLPEGTDLAKALVEFHRLQRFVFYDGSTDTISLAPESVKLGRALSDSDNRRAETLPQVFALTNALQNQNFPWPSKIAFIPAEDRRLSFQAVAGGDVVLTALAYLGGNRPAQSSAQLQAVSRLVNKLNSLASGLPAMLRERLIFPYREGSQFVQWGYAAQGFAGVNALFVNPPLSTAQVMHPEKFYIRRQNPLRITAWGLIEQMKTGAIIERTLGEYLTQWLLTSAHSRSEAARIASAWTGDHLSVYAEGESLTTCWLTAWNNETNAQEFFRAYGAVLTRQRGLRLQTSVGSKNGLKAEVAGGTTTLLQVRGSLVLFLDGVESAQASDLAEQIWQDLETGPESTNFPFDTAHRGRQLASRRR